MVLTCLRLLAISILLLVPSLVMGQDLEYDSSSSPHLPSASLPEECEGFWECIATLVTPSTTTAFNLNQRIAVSRYLRNTTFVLLIDPSFPEGTEVEITVDGAQRYLRKTISEGAEIKLDAKLAKALARGSRAVIILRSSGEEVERLEASLTGFASALRCVRK